MSEIHKFKDIPEIRESYSWGRLLEEARKSITKEDVINSFSPVMQEFLQLDNEHERPLREEDPTDLDATRDTEATERVDLSVENMIKRRAEIHTDRLMELFPKGVEFTPGMAGKALATFVHGKDVPPAEDVVRQAIDALFVQRLTGIFFERMAESK